MIARVLLKRGVVVPPHPHHNEQFSYILQGVNTNAYTFSNPVAASGSNANPACNLAAHTNECLVPSSTFQTPTTTSGFLLGSRQIQFGFRFGF